MRLTRHEFLASLGAVATVPLEPFAQAHGPAPTPGSKNAAEQAGIDATGTLSFAQSGEDLIADFIFKYLGIPKVTYLDVGAHEPVAINNTYFFYRRGFRGVLVEPNVEMCTKLRAVRPEDTTLEAGIGVTAAREADYYVMTESAWNTFSKEEAEHMTRVTKGGITVQRVIKMPLLEINAVMAKHFGGAPTFVSIDAEGLHLAILKTIDFKRFRPAVICVETLVAGTKRQLPEIPAFMETQKYVVRGSTFVNTIFVDGNLIG
jgi:Methyltransferase FkbM domain